MENKPNHFDLEKLVELHEKMKQAEVAFFQARTDFAHCARSISQDLWHVDPQSYYVEHNGSRYSVTIPGEPDDSRTPNVVRLRTPDETMQEAKEYMESFLGD